MPLRGGGPTRSAVVLAEPRPVHVVRPAAVAFELGRVLDLILGEADEELALVRVDALDRPGRDDNLTAEDPRTGVDDQERPTRLVRRLVDLSDRSVARLDLVPDEVHRLGSEDVRSVSPQFGVHHRTSFVGSSLPYPPGNAHPRPRSLQRNVFAGLAAPAAQAGRGVREGRPTQTRARTRRPPRGRGRRAFWDACVLRKVAAGRSRRGLTL